jgi:hypothetical protein
MNRSTCVICHRSDNFVEIHRLEKYPITPSSNSLELSSDEFNDCSFVSCILCGSVQLKTLIDPFKLYKDSHNSTENTPTWKEHHQLFAEFISESTNIDSILEVGGNSGILYTYLKKEIPNYTILDICDTNDRPMDITFIEGNCETYDFNGHKTVVLSHTFEHLYNPIKFIDNLSRGKVESVYISIPNMEQLYQSKNISIIHNEHTFFVGDNEIRFLFSKSGYVCKIIKAFKKHSLFYHFIYDASSQPLTLYKNMERANYIKSYLKEFEESVSKIVIDKPSFICPAGHYGQKIFYYLQKYSANIIGFIDNDISKQDKRVYGTTGLVYSPNILQKYKDTTINVILYAGPYTEELKNQLNLLHPNIKYIIIY